MIRDRWFIDYFGQRIYLTKLGLFIKSSNYINLLSSPSENAFFGPCTRSGNGSAKVWGSLTKASYNLLS